MRKFILMLVAAFVLGAAQFASAEDSKEAVAVFNLSPKMTCQNCENKVKTNIRFEKGVSDIQTNLKAQTVTIKYNPAKTNTEALVAAFKKIGYTATEVDHKANCPTAQTQGCQGCPHHKK